MGLDMYLQRMPRYKDCTADQVSLIEDYLSLQEYREETGNADMTLPEWCGRSESELPPPDAVEFYKQFYAKKSEDAICPRICEEVGYWRKVNAVHNWFVENIQCGEDDCQYHREVTAEDLRNLIGLCTRVLSTVQLVPGRIHTGTVFSSEGVKKTYEKGFVIANKEVCEELLPTVSGFFFGAQDYNQYYLDDLQDTIKICDEALRTTDFETQMLFYCSSW